MGDIMAKVSFEQLSREKMSDSLALQRPVSYTGVPHGV